jgi:hypothetical protein
MRFLIFLLLGTLIFGFAFPAFLLIFGFFALVIIAAIIIGALRGGTFHVYTNRDFDQRRESPPDDPEVLNSDEQPFDNDQYEAPREEEGQTDEDDGEVVELPASALHKDDGEENKDESKQQQ